MENRKSLGKALAHLIFYYHILHYLIVNAEGAAGTDIQIHTSHKFPHFFFPPEIQNYLWVRIMLSDNKFRFPPVVNTEIAVPVRPQLNQKRCS